ncbi:MAG: CBS domain-containing protein [Chloroflexota bacterium]|nr:CBS domain-containing protein [Chloroflexota bacterium]
MKVKEIMTTPVICATADASTAEVATLLAKHRISAVPVVDGEGSIIGLVSEYDLLARKGKAARDIMSPGIISVSEDADVEDVRFLIVERRVRRIPVVAGRTLVGIVSRSDLVRQMAMQWYCDLCGEPVRDEHPPDRCPKCTAPAARFTHAEHLPGD